MLGFLLHGMLLTEADSSALLALVPAPRIASYKTQNKPQTEFLSWKDISTLHNCHTKIIES